jgi:hypothetical protein
LRPPAATLAEQQAVFDRFAQYYNEVRPHAALAGVPPAVVYTPSVRPYRPVPEDFAFPYPAEWVVRRVHSAGEVKWANGRHFVSEALIGEWLGYRPLTTQYWGVYLGSLALAVWEPARRRYLPKRRAAEVLLLAGPGQQEHLGQADGLEPGSETVTDVLE